MSQSIIVRFPDEMVAALKARQADLGVTMSEQIRRAVNASLEPKAVVKK
jgi:hypothetical protein